MGIREAESKQTKKGEPNYNLHVTCVFTCTLAFPNRVKSPVKTSFLNKHFF